MAAPGDDVAGQPPAQPRLRPEPYMGLFRRFRIKSDDAWTLAIEWGASFLIFLLAIIIVFACYYALPSPISSLDAGPNKFSEVRAQIHLTALADTIGTRPYGSVANRIGVRDYLLGQLTRIQEQTRVNGLNRISFTVRNHPGEVPKYFKGAKWKRVWESMGNILVHVHAETSGKAAFLVSGHYDTVFLSPGAADNTAGISSMLETIEVLAHDKPAKHEAVFAFVNGEEFGLLGAADLARYDSEFLNIAAFLNIDGTPGAKQINFRSTGGWLDNEYGAVPRPLSFVVANDIFGSGIIHSNTDWSVYSEKLPGLDFATFSRRQTYHTMKDKPSSIADGLLQFQGDNMLALIRHVINMDVDSLAGLKEDRTPHVYFSFLNKGYITYTLSTSYTVHVMLIIGYLIIYSIILVHRYIYWKDMGMGSSSHPLACLFVGGAFIFATFLVCFCITCLFGLISALAPYFSYPGIGLAVFAFTPLAMFCIYVFQFILYKAEKYFANPLEVDRHRLLWGTGLCWWLLLIVTSGASKWAGTTYLIFFMALFHLISVVLHHVFFFFGVLTERPNADMYEILENAEKEEDRADEREYEERGQVTKRPVRPADHQRWRAAFTWPDIAWYLIYITFTFPSLLFFLDVMVPFLQMAAGEIPSWLIAPFIALVVLLANIGFLPLSRRGHHYGFIATILLAATILTYIPLIIGGSSTFSHRAPYIVVPEQVGPRMTFKAEHAYSTPIRTVSKTIAPDRTWTCNSTECYSSGFRTPPLPTSTPIYPPHGFAFAAQINSTNAWVHDITFPKGTNYVFLNGIYTSVDPNNATVTFLLSSLPATSQWTVEYNGPVGLIDIQSYYDDLLFVPALPALIAKLPDWATFKGRGSWLASHKYSVLCQY